MKLCQHAPYSVDDTIRWIKEIKFETVFLVEEKGKNGRIHLQGLLSHKHNADYIQRDKNGLKYSNKDYKNITISGKYDKKDITADGGDIFLRYLCKGYEPEKRSPVRMKYVYPLDYLMDVKVLELQQKYWDIHEDYKSNNKLYKKIKSITITTNIIKTPNLSIRQRQEIEWYMKIILYYDKEDKLQPNEYLIKKMINTFMFKEVDEKDKEYYAMKTALYSLGLGENI